MEEYKFNESEWEIIHYNDGKFCVRQRKETAEQWVARMLTLYTADKTVDCAIAGNFVFVCNTSGKVAQARCAVGDLFNSHTGIAIAYARLMGLPIHPDFVCEKKIKPETKTAESTQKFKIGESVRIKATGELAVVQKFYAFRNTYKVYKIWCGNNQMVKEAELEHIGFDKGE